MDTTISISEVKKDLYGIQHVLVSDQAEDIKWHSVEKLRKYIVEDKYYSCVRFYDVLRMMLDSLNIDSSTWQYYKADDFFLKSNTFDSFLALLHHFDKTDLSERVADLLEKFIVSSNLKNLILNECIVLESNDSWDEIIVCLASLPERVANKFKAKTRNAFLPDVYVKHLTLPIFAVLQEVKVMLALEKDVNLEFLSRLLGKLCIVGYADILFEYLYPRLICVIENNFLWRRICQRLICGVPQRCMEAVLVALLQKVAWYGHVEWILGDTINSRQNIQYLLTTKFMTLRYFEKDLLPQNVIGYLAHSEKRRSLFHKVVLSLLDVWSDGSALRHQSYAQQFYLSRLLMIGTGHLKKEGMGIWRQDFTERLLKGVHNRIASSQPSVRILGMVVAEAMSSVLNSEGPELKFQYEENEETAYLHSLLVIPEDPKANSEEMKEIDAPVSEAEEDITNKENNMKSSTTDGDLDSDDDLEAYDLSNDKSVLRKKPLYLIECLKGLMDQEKPEWVQACLECTENLIRQKPDNLNEIAIDLCKVLLHQENHYALPNFAHLKQSSLVALCVHCPILIAEFLSREFYDRNYSIRQRVDILQVLAVASAELSGVESVIGQNISAEKSNNVITEEVQKDIEGTWKLIVAKRIATKTRVISKRRDGPLPKENKFAKVAGYFFFTLLAHFDGKGSVDLLGGDSYLLGHFIYTLGIIMHSAVHIPIAGQMGKYLLEFIWTMRYHNDAFVQKALLFSLCMVLSSVPSHTLLSDLQEYIVECKFWLQSIIDEGFDTECKMVARQALALLQECLREEGVLPCSVTERL